jgi:hypothetical protein
MTPEQCETVVSFAAGKASLSALVQVLGVDISANPLSSAAILSSEVSAQNAEGVEAALILSFRFGLTPSHSDALIQLVTATWHTRHEDVALALEQIRHPDSVDVLYEAASKTYRTVPTLQHDDGHAFARKCVWALARIGTQEARAKLELLSQSDDAEVKGYANERLADARRHRNA